MGKTVSPEKEKIKRTRENRVKLLMGWDGKGENKIMGWVKMRRKEREGGNRVKNNWS